MNWHEALKAMGEGLVIGLFGTVVLIIIHAHFQRKKTEEELFREIRKRRKVYKI